MTAFYSRILSLFPKVFMFGLFCVCVNVVALGQSPQETFQKEIIVEEKIDKQKWKELTADIDYSGQSEKIETERDSTDTFGEVEVEQTTYSGDWALGKGLFHAFAVIFLIAIVVLIVFYLINGEFSKSNQKIRAKDIFTIEDIEEHIHETELEKYIREAKAKGNYALAIRFYYLLVIKEMSLTKMIKWKRDKTNGEYLREIRGSNHFEAFREVTNIFERIRYGGGVIDLKLYSMIEPKFKNLVNQLRR